MVVTSAQRMARIRALAAAPQAGGLVHVDNDQVGRQRDLRCTNWAEPDLNALGDSQPLRELLARAGASQ